MFSNYLTPKIGFFSGDTWAMIAIYLRNLLLNLTTVLALLATFLLLPSVAKAWACTALACPRVGYGLAAMGLAPLSIAFLMILVNMGFLSAPKMKQSPRFTEQRCILLLVSAPLFGAAVAAALWLTKRSPFLLGKSPLALTSYEVFPYENSVLIGAIGYCAIWGLARLGEVIYGKQMSAAKKNVATVISQRSRFRGGWMIEAGASVCAGALAGWLFALLSGLPFFHGVAAALTVGVPLVVAVFLIAGVLQIGLMGVIFRDWKREWWGRLSGWLLLFAIVWLALFWLALFFPSFIRHDALVSAAWKTLAAKYLTPAWILSTFATVFAGNSKASGKPDKANWMDAAITVGPYVFGVGLLCWISYGIDSFLGINGPLYRTLFVCAAVTLLMAWRVDINQFSMHMFYRNRLVACFLGASNSDRSPNRFTGFDPGDDLPLKDFRWNAPKPYDGPYPVLNASLNLVKGKDLAWQERKAESFVMTPHFCGYDVWLEEQDSPMLMHDRPTTDDRKRVDGLVTATATAVARQANVPSSASIAGKEDPAQSTESWLERALDTICKTGHKLERFGYRATEDYAFPVPGFNGPNLGLAMAISGAAVSPNMGFYSSTPVAFLMTIFNVRLGQWLGNPRHPITSRRATPRLGLWWLINELLGGTNDDAAYVYLSDGGHFENMGLYELVKRRCGLIIVCDAEADENYTFSGIGNAIRKCRIDLGIDIDLDTSKIAPPKAGRWSEQHCAVGRIHYENADQFARTGIIIYFKASLTGDEDADVKNYKKEHALFPHESTVDQWFSESQFESYRELGYHVMHASVTGIQPNGGMPHEHPNVVETELQGIFKEFGFEVEHSRKRAESVE